MERKSLFFAIFPLSFTPFFILSFIKFHWRTGWGGGGVRPPDYTPGYFEFRTFQICYIYVPMLLHYIGYIKILLNCLLACYWFQINISYTIILQEIKKYSILDFRKILFYENSLLFFWVAALNLKFLHNGDQCFAAYYWLTMQKELNLFEDPLKPILYDLCFVFRCACDEEMAYHD